MTSKNSAAVRGSSSTVSVVQSSEQHGKHLMCSSLLPLLAEYFNVKPYFISPIITIAEALTAYNCQLADVIFQYHRDKELSEGFLFEYALFLITLKKQCLVASCNVNLLLGSYINILDIRSNISS